MYQVGDKLVYPVHGAGIVEAIESREVAGCSRQYLVLNMPFNSLRVMVPLEEAEKVGLRELMSREDTERVLQILEGAARESSPAVQALALQKWNNRFRLQMLLIKNGNVYELAEIVYELGRRNRQKPLSTGEKRVLEQAREILYSELWLIGTLQPSLQERIDAILNSPL